MYREEKKLINRKTEKGVLFDPETGEKIWEKAGKKHSVPLTRSEVNSLEGKVFTHNHPSNQHHMSAADVEVAIESNAREIRTITRSRRASLFAGRDGWPDRDRLITNKRTGKQYTLPQHAKDKHNDVYSRLFERFKKGELTAPEAEVLHGSTVWSELVDELDWELYYREEKL